jgi:hypothetical protein
MVWHEKRREQPVLWAGPTPLGKQGGMDRLKNPDWHQLFQAKKGQRGLLEKDVNAFSLGIGDEGIEEYYSVLDPESHPLVILSTMEDLRKRLEKAGLTAPIEVK